MMTTTTMAVQGEEDVFVVATVPPPPGESDVYNAATKLQAPPIAMVTAMMNAGVDIEQISAILRREDVIEAIEEEEQPESSEIVESDLAVDVDMSLAPPPPVPTFATDVEIAFPKVLYVDLSDRLVEKSNRSAQPFAIAFAAGIVTVVGGVIAALSFFV